MIPRVLQLRNFLSYASQLQVIDFRPHSLMCLSGKNGHGKSALLDAMTWAVWGQARRAQGTVKADEGVVRLGQSRALVDFEFSVGDDIYRVRREFFKGHAKAIASLDFDVFDKTTQSFKSLTDKTIRQTQHKIEQTIKLDFETFLNTAFFRQGAANEFSKRTPKERKQILARILGLEKYDRMSNIAHERARAQQEVLQRLERDAAQGTQIITQIPELAETFATLQHKVVVGKKDLMAKQQQQLQLTSKQVQLDGLRQRVQQLVVQQQQTQQNLLAWRADLHKRRVLTNAGALAAEKNALLIEKQQLQQQLQQQPVVCQQFRKTAFQYQNLKQRVVQLYNDSVAKVDLMVQKHQLNVAAQQQQLTMLNNAIAGQQKQIEHLHTQLQALKKQQLVIAAQSSQLPGLQILAAKYNRYQALILERLPLCRQKLLQAKACTQSLHQESHEAQQACPTCMRQMDEALAEKLAKEYSWQLQYYTHCGLRLKAAMERLKELDAACQQQCTQLQVVCNELLLMDMQLKNLQTQELSLSKEFALNQQQQQQQNLVAAVAHELLQQALQERLNLANRVRFFASTAEHRAVCEQRQQLLSMYQQLQAYKVPAVRISYVEQRIGQIQTQQEQMLAAQNERQVVAAKLLNFYQNHRQAKAQLQALNAEVAALEVLGIENSVQQIKTELSAIESQLQADLTAVGSVQQQLESAQKIANHSSTLQQKIFTCKQELEDFSVLAQAFSRNGIQALIIESIIPEIELEANKILTKLTENSATIFIEPLRDLKKGGFKESLEIKIADNSGVRDYEMFSGGEAFRIDFALRIAISKLLARRAGACLQTLIIDEGFGSQDQDGIERVLQAIYSIQQDFSKVIIVSHLQEMKDSCPVHFLVEKHAGGSQVSLELRG